MNDSVEVKLPKTWVITSISEVTEVNPKFDKSSLDDDVEVSFVPMPAVEAASGVIDVTTIRKFGDVKKGYTGFLEGDVLFAKITPCMENGKMAVVPALKNNVGFGSTEFHVLRTYRGVSQKYIYYFVASKRVRYDAEHNMAGAVGQKRVTTMYLSGREIPVPPTNEQHRIVAKIETLFSELDKGIESLKTAREQLKVYRQAVLKNAFEGKLTAQWREQNNDKLETPPQLLARIQQERQARYQQKLQEWQVAVKMWEENGKKENKPGKPKKLAALKETSENETRNFPQLPVGWTYVRLGLLIEEPTYGTSKKCSYDSGQVGVLRIPNISHGAIDSSDLKFASFEEHEVKALALTKGDLLTIRSNGSVSLVGSCALIAEDGTDFLFAGYLIRLRPNPDLVAPLFLLSVLTSHLLRRQIESAAKSTSGVNNINTGEIQNLIVPLPSMVEQVELLKFLGISTPNIGVAEHEIEVQLKKSEVLRQSVLKKAFSGQLVPQDPNDEPASALLARIQAEKSAQATSKVSHKNSPAKGGRKAHSKEAS